MDFFNDISVLYDVVRDDCTPESCPTMRAGPKYLWRVALTGSYEFLWRDNDHYRRPTQLPAKVYIECLLNWLVIQLENERIFPVEDGSALRAQSLLGTPFPPDYEKQTQTIFRRMFRVYAHIWCK